MVKSKKKCKNLQYRIKQAGVSELIDSLGNLSQCKKINPLNLFLSSPSKNPMLNGFYFLDDNTLQRNNLPVDNSKIALYLAGNNPKGIVVYLTPNENKNKLHEQLLEKRLGKIHYRNAA